MIARPRSLWEALRRHRACRSCRGYPISPRCLALGLDLIPPDACPRCAQRRAGGRCDSLGCRRGWLRIGRTYVALGYKRGDTQRLLLAAKDAAQPGAITLLGRLLAGFLLRHGGLGSYDVILPVPFHPRCLRGRPVHPLTAIYLDAAPALRPILPVDDLDPPFLVQVRAVSALRGRREEDRWRAVRGAFALGFATRMLRGARVAVIDDVMTTGATLNECARVLCETGGAASVDAVVLMRQPWFSDARRDVPSAMRARDLTISGGQV
ncbi:MAG TPA: phosphoribosyltransferase family protein [bacterium]|nr:phosphoribosyltransferase family protein [bacterium]